MFKATGSLDTTLSLAPSSAGVGLNFAGHAQEGVALNNIWRASLEFDPRSEFNYYIDKSPEGFVADSKSFFLIKEIVAADIANCESLRLQTKVPATIEPESKAINRDGNACINPPEAVPSQNPTVQLQNITINKTRGDWTFPLTVSMSGDSTRTLKGPGLVMGVRGIFLQRGPIVRQGPFPIPAHGETPASYRLEQYPGNYGPYTLSIERMNSGEARFKILEIIGAQMWVETPDGSYVPEKNEKDLRLSLDKYWDTEMVAVVLPSPNTPQWDFPHGGGGNRTETQCP